MSKRIPLHGKWGKGLFATVDEESYEWLNQYHWFGKKLGSMGSIYAQRSIYTRRDGVSRYRYESMHRMIMGAMAGQQVDHRNGDTLDNTKSNLRFATASSNQQNRHARKANGSSRYKGVCWNAKSVKWQAGIKLNGKSKHLGLYEEETDAALAYDAAARWMFGEFANVNFSEDTA